MKSSYELTDSEFSRFKEIVYREAGINLSDLKKALLQARLMRRMRHLKLDTYADYYQYLIDHYEEEVGNFVNAVTTNKTDFFREPKHFDYMTEHFLPEFDRSGRNKMRIWSAGCSTGEEPYTIAMVLHEYYSGRTMPDIKILATDIDTQVLETGRNGTYPQNQIEDIPDQFLRKYFMRGTGGNEGLYRAKKPLRDMISFRRLNLHSETFPMAGPFDLIFCRNVIIYFDRESQRHLFRKFHQYLHPEGLLFIGHSENLNAVSKDFYLVSNTTYRKSMTSLS